MQWISCGVMKATCIVDIPINPLFLSFFLHFNIYPHTEGILLYFRVHKKATPPKTLLYFNAFVFNIVFPATSYNFHHQFCVLSQKFCALLRNCAFTHKCFLPVENPNLCKHLSSVSRYCKSFVSHFKSVNAIIWCSLLLY